MKIGAALSRLAFAGLLATTVVGVAGCYDDYETVDPAYYPPASTIATVEPVYYGGRPVYFYNDHWYYRNGGGWAYYRSEPGFLRDRRGWYAPGGRYYRGAYRGGAYRGGAYRGNAYRGHR